MNADDFNKVFDETIAKSRGVLIKKAGEYADDTDRLLNFKKSAAMLTDSDPISALGGMMIKHTTSVYDYIGRVTDDISVEAWDEKIIDHINYLILLRALVIENEREQANNTKDN